MEVFPNWTAVPIILFLIVLTYIMNRTFFIPLGAALGARDRRIGGARQEAEEIKKASQDRIAEFDKRMRDARRASDQVMAEAKQRAQQEREMLLATRRQEVEKMLQESRSDIRKRTEEAHAKLETEIGRFAHEIASRILRRPVKS